MPISRSTLLYALTAVLAAGRIGIAQQPRELHAGDSFDSAIAAGSAHDYRVQLARGESAELVVMQIGVDLVVELRDPAGALVSIFDSPNGRNGPEPVEILADQSGPYVVRVRPYDNREPAGRYHLQVLAVRNAAATGAMMRVRQVARDSAISWLTRRSAPIPVNGMVSSRGALPPLDTLAARARVIGIGEATHGSREFGDLRVALTRRLIERDGYRVVAIEASTARLSILNRYVAGELPENAYVNHVLYSGIWIGRRAQRELVRWLRDRNRAHPNDHVALVGVDPQDNAAERDSLVSFLSSAYGPEFMTRLAPMFAEFAAADSQTVVFGDTEIDSTARRILLELTARLELDAPVLRRRFGASQVESARAILREMQQDAEFNSAGGGLLNRSRDYYMAANVLDALDRAGPRAKAIYWAHNAHVTHPQGQSNNARTAGAWLREWLGCSYAAVGVAFGEGSFVAEIPNDPTDRLAISTLPAPPDESIDAVLGAMRKEATFASWPCVVDDGPLPSWLMGPHPMHWVGGLYAPGSPPSEAFRPFNLVKDFDAVVYFPRVTADEMPAQPLIPGRKR